MNDPDDAQGWRDMGQHLIEAHGGSSGGLACMRPRWTSSASRTPTPTLRLPASAHCRRTVTRTPCP